MHQQQMRQQCASWWTELYLNRPVQALADAPQQNVERDGVWAEPACLHVLQHSLR